MIARALALLLIACGAPRVEAPIVEAPPRPADPPRTCRFESGDDVRIETWDERGRSARVETQTGATTTDEVTSYVDGVTEVRTTSSSGETRTERLRFEIGDGIVVVRYFFGGEWTPSERLWLDDEGRVTRIWDRSGEEPRVTRCVREGGRVTAVLTREDVEGGADDIWRLSYDEQGRVAAIEIGTDDDAYVMSVRYEGARAIVTEDIDDSSQTTVTSADCVDVWLEECAPSYRIMMPAREEQRAALDDLQDVREAYARETGEILEESLVIDRDRMPGAILVVEQGELRGGFIGGEYLREPELSSRGLALLGYASSGDAELALAWIRNVLSHHQQILEAAPEGWPSSRGAVAPPAIVDGDGGARVVTLWERRPTGRQPAFLRWEHTIDRSGAIRTRLLEAHEGL